MRDADPHGVSSEHLAQAETQRARSASDREKLAVAPRMQGASWPRRLEHICSAAASSTLGSESAAAPAEPSVYPNLPLDFVPRCAFPIFPGAPELASPVLSLPNPPPSAPFTCRSRRPLPCMAFRLSVVEIVASLAAGAGAAALYLAYELRVRFPHSSPRPSLAPSAALRPR